MDHERVVGDLQDGSESVGSDVGGTIPPLQGSDLPATADAGMYMSEEFRQTVHAWRGTELPVQSVVSRAEVEELARDAESALQATAEQSAWDVARLTHETGATFGRVEAAMLDMDSRVESLDDRLLRLQEEQIQQQQRTQDTLHSTAALEQQLHLTEAKMKQQADQNQATLQEQRKYILNLEQLMRAEVKSHQQANDTLQQATGEKSALKEEVQELSQRLGSALDQIQKLTMDLATTKSLLDMQDRNRHATNAGASTSAPAATTLRIPAQDKGKKTPSRADTPMVSAGSRQAAPSKDDDSGKHGLDDGGDSDDGSSLVGSDGYIRAPQWRSIHKKKLAEGIVKTLGVVGRPQLHLHTHQHIFGLTLNRKTHLPIMGRQQRTWRCGHSRLIITCSYWVVMTICRLLTLEPCCKGLHSFGSSVKTMQGDAPGPGHSWLSRCVIALGILPKLITLSPSCRLCGRVKMNRPTTTLYVLRQCWTRFQRMRRVGSRISLSGACIPTLPRKST